MGQTRPLFFLLFSTQWQYSTKFDYKKRRWWAWDSNPGQQDGRRRRICWAMAAPLIPLYVIHIRGLKDFVPTTPQFNKKEMTYIVLILSHLKTLFGISRHSSFKVRFTCDQCDQMARLFPFVTMKIFAQRKNLFLNKVQQIAKYLPNPKQYYQRLIQFCQIWPHCLWDVMSLQQILAFVSIILRIKVTVPILENFVELFDPRIMQQCFTSLSRQWLQKLTFRVGAQWPIL